MGSVFEKAFGFWADRQFDCAIQSTFVVTPEAQDSVELRTLRRGTDYKFYYGRSPGRWSILERPYLMDLYFGSIDCNKYGLILFLITPSPRDKVHMLS